jgi:hypothetical protein
VPSDAGDDDGSTLPVRCATFAPPDLSGATVVGNGSPGSCNEASVRAAISLGGAVVLDCGRETITMGSEIVIVADTIVDARMTTLDGQNTTRIFRVPFPGYSFTLMNAWLKQGNSTESGGAILVEYGTLTVATSLFQNNTAVQQSNIEGGGAIAALPADARIAIYGTIFNGNRASNGGAILVYSDAAILDSTFVGNTATGMGGSMMQGGNGGAISAAGNGDLLMCDDVLMSNNAGSSGGALLRVSVDASAVDRFERVRIESNMAASGGGGAYIQDSVTTMRQVSFAYNNGSPVGGLWFQGGQFDGVNLAVAENYSFSGLGAGLLFNAPTTLAFSTVANNYANCPTCFAAAIHGAQNVTLISSIVTNNKADDLGGPTSCNLTAIDGGANFQWPTEAQLCANGVSIVDPALAALVQTAGPAGDYSVRRPLAGSPVIGAVTASCPDVDILGNPRPTPCAAGAVE